MKIYLLFFTVIIFFLSCNNPSSSGKSEVEKEAQVKQSFFPVTSFVRGELYEIKNKGINPLKYTTINNHTDSVWLKIEDLDSAVSDFLNPVIDTANLIPLFIEKSFLDQSIGAFTFTYEAKAKLPDSMILKHWDVYIDPATGKVRRIYLVKEISKTKTLQLIWQSKKWCKITSIITDQNGNSTVEKEEKITWDF